MGDLRELKLDGLADAAEEAKRLLQGGYLARGNWSLGQICRHLCLVQDPALTNYPAWMSVFAALRPLMKHFVLPRLLSPSSPRGIPALPAFDPGKELEDEVEVKRYVESVRRFLAHDGDFAPHPAFGRLSREQLEAVHAAHAAHHLRFLESKPKTDANHG